MAYETQSAELARCAVRSHGALKEVDFVSGNKDYTLVFADGTRFTPSNDAELEREYSTGLGYGEIAQQLGGTHPYSLLAFGYQGTGPGCFATFLQTAGFDVTEQDIVDISPPVRLRPDGSHVGDIASEEAAPAEAVEPASVAAAVPEEAVVEEPVVEEPAPERPAVDAPASQPAPPANWYADPMGRHQYRYWNGTAWTENVADNGAGSLDPLAAPAAPVATRPAAQSGPVEFDEDGRVKKITFPQQGIWPSRQSGQSTYMTRSVGTLLEATETLLKLQNIPGLHYYVVETPDGALCRDMNDFYTEAPLKTKGLHLVTQPAASGPVEFESLTEFGNLFANQSSVAAVKKSGQYAKLVLLMECGRCGYKSPVETEAGDMERECYCCGTTNTGSRGTVNVMLDAQMVEI